MQKFRDWPLEIEFSVNQFVKKLECVYEDNFAIVNIKVSVRGYIKEHDWSTLKSMAFVFFKLTTRRLWSNREQITFKSLMRLWETDAIESLDKWTDVLSAKRDIFEEISRKAR